MFLFAACYECKPTARFKYCTVGTRCSVTDCSSIEKHIQVSMAEKIRQDQRLRMDKLNELGKVSKIMCVLFVESSA